MCDSLKVMNEVKKAALSKKKIHIKKVFTGEKNIAFKFGNEDIQFNYSLTKSQVSNLLRMSLFHLLQFYEKDSLTEDNNHNCKIIIISLLHIAKDLETGNEIAFLQECANSIFKNPLVLRYFLPVYKKKNVQEQMFTDTFLEICETLYSFNKDCTNVDIINLYKEKFITLLQSIVAKCKAKEKLKHLVKAEFFKTLYFNVFEMVDLIRIIMELPTDRFLASNKSSLSIWGETVSNLINACLEKNYTSRNVFPLDVDLLKKLFSTLTVLKTKVNMFLWEESLCKYLQRFSHNIGDVDKKTFVSLLRNEMSTETIKLVSLLVNRNAADIPQFIKMVKKDDSMMKKCSIMLPILGSNLTYKWDKQFLSKLYELNKNEIVSYLTEPSSENSWIQENVTAIIYLIESSFDSQTCQEICNSILVNGDKLNKVDIEYVQLIDCCFKKVKMYKEFLQVLINLLASTLKLCKSKTTVLNNKKKLEFLCQRLISIVETLKTKNEKFVYEGLSKNHSWPQFVRFSLTHCLKLSEEDKSLNNTLLLKAFIAACSVSYNDNGNDEYVKTIFGLATSHSEYVDIMLSSSSIKRYLVELLLILIRKNTSMMLPNHVPFYLSAYSASLSESDQILLLILKQYENSNIDLNKYRPFLWGSAAASHYSVKDDPDCALWNQPKTSQILDLFVPEMVNNTITRFPVQRTLKNDVLCAPEDVYDPVFYLPVLCEVLSVHNLVAYYKVTHSGALALMLIACCSNCDQIRLASYTVLSRFYFHLENLDVKRSNESLLWIRFIDALRNGIVELGTSMKDVSLNGFVATFLARSSIVGTQPLHPLYRPLHKFFMAKPALKLNTIPEFKKLFHSTEADYQAHRSWILEIIRDGFRSENDLQIAINCSVFNILLSFYVSSLSDKPTRKSILEIINTVAKIPKSACLLVNYYGIIPWLDAIIDRLHSSDSDLVPLLVDITKNLFESFTKRNMKDKFSSLILLQVSLTLKSVMTPKNITVSCFTTYIDTLGKILSLKGVYLPEKHMNELLELAKELLENMGECEDLLMYGSEFALKETEDKLENANYVALKSFRNLIIRYHCSKKTLNKN